MDSIIALAPPTIDPAAGLIALFALLFVPHVYKGTLLLGSNSGYDNSNPRGHVERSISQLQKTAEKGSKDEKHAAIGQIKAIQRAAAAHSNGIEFFCFFAAAVILARVVGVDATFVARATTVAVASRAAYTVVYLFGSSQAVAGIRSLIWAVGLGSVFSLLWKASATDGGLASTLFA